MPKKQKRKARPHWQTAAAEASNKNPSPRPTGKASTTAPASSKKGALIIAIDFGTTFSGVAWHHTISTSGKPHIIREWPGQNQSLNKVPTVLRYSKKGTQWGHVRAPRSRLEWFKLLLNEKDYSTPDELLSRLESKGLKGYRQAASTNINLAHLRTTIKAIPAEKKPVDLAADYLRELYEYAKLTLGQSLPTLEEDLGREGGLEIKCCLTVPAIWNDKAKDLTKLAAINAGIREKELYMISEPEAAAVHALKGLEGVKGDLKVGDVYVIVDCGGGTVDLISYQVTSISPLRVIECNIGSGGLCGSTLINRHFEELVIRRIGQQLYDQMDEEDCVQMRSYFDTEIKPRFFPDDSNDSDEEDEEDNWVCPLPGVPDDSSKRIRRGKITFSTKEMEEIFEPTFKEITTLVQKQVTDAQKATEKNVDAIILVGGFGSSNYLAKWLEKSIRNKDGNQVKMIRPPEPSTSIVLGAVEHGIQQHRAGNSLSWGIVESRKARCHYGISLSEPYIPYIHPTHKLYRDPVLGIVMCAERMTWLIRKGGNMRQGVGIKEQFFRRRPVVDSEEEQKQLLVVEEEIYASEADIAPDDEEDPGVYKLLTYKTDLNDVDRTHFTRRRLGMTGPIWWDIKATIFLRLESVNLTFATVVGGKQCGKGITLYHHEGRRDVHRISSTSQQGWADTLSEGRAYALDIDGNDEEDYEGVEEALEMLDIS